MGKFDGLFAGRATAPTPAKTTPTNGGKFGNLFASRLNQPDVSIIEPDFPEISVQIVDENGVPKAKPVKTERPKPITVEPMSKADASYVAQRKATGELFQGIKEGFDTGAKLIGKGVQKGLDFIGWVNNKNAKTQLDFHNKLADDQIAKFGESTVKKYNTVEEMQADAPIMKFFNSPTGKKIISETADKTSDLPLKLVARLASIGDLTYEQAKSKFLEDRNNPENGAFKKFLYEVQDSGPQTMIGVLLSLGAGYLSKGNPYVTEATAGAYWTAISASEQLQKKGKVYSLGNLAIDVAGDRLLGSTLEGLFKQPVKTLAQTMSKSFMIEGTTETAQSLLKFANDYQGASGQAEKQMIVRQATNYVKSGDMLMEFLVGGVIGAGVGGAVSKFNLSTFKSEAVLNEKLAQDVIKDAQIQLGSEYDLSGIDTTSIKSWGDLFTKMTAEVRGDAEAVNTVRNHLQTRWKMFINEPEIMQKIVGNEFETAVVEVKNTFGLSQSEAIEMVNFIKKQNEEKTKEFVKEYEQARDEITQEEKQTDDIKKAVNEATNTIIDNIPTESVSEVKSALEQYVFYNNRKPMTEDVQTYIESLKIKPVDTVTLYRDGEVNGGMFQSWSKDKNIGENPVSETFTPDQILIDLTDPRALALFDNIAKESMERYQKLENEVIIKPRALDIDNTVAKKSKTKEVARSFIESAKKYNSAEDFQKSIVDRLENPVAGSSKETLGNRDYTLEIKNISDMSEWEAKTPSDQKKIDKIKALIKSGVEMPPIMAWKGAEKFMVYDGHHRLEAYKELGMKEVAILIQKKRKGSGRILNISTVWGGAKKIKAIKKKLPPREEALTRQKALVEKRVKKVQSEKNPDKDTIAKMQATIDKLNEKIEEEKAKNIVVMDEGGDNQYDRKATVKIGESPFALKFKKQGSLTFAKEKVTSPADLAFAFKQLKNEGVEHFYVVAMKGDIPLAVEAVSMGTLNASLVHPREVMGLLLKKGADGAYFVHNHPSGNITPSEADIQLSARMRDVMKEFNMEYKSHVIIDSIKFGTIDVNGVIGEETHIEIAKNPKKISLYKKYIEFTNEDWLTNKYKINRASDVFELSKGFDKDKRNGYLAFYMSADNSVITVEAVGSKKMDYKKILRGAVLNRSASMIVVRGGFSSSEAGRDEMMVQSGRLLDLGRIYGITVNDVIAIHGEDNSSFISVMETKPAYKPTGDIRNLGDLWDVTTPRERRQLASGLFPERIQNILENGADQLFYNDAIGELDNYFSARLQTESNQETKPVPDNGAVDLVASTEEPQDGPGREEKPLASKLMLDATYLDDPGTKKYEEEVDKVIKRSDIAKTLAEKLSVPVRRGKYRGQALGIYKPKESVIRLKMGGLSTLFHETGHFLDKEVHPFHKELPASEIEPLLTEYQNAPKDATRRRGEAFSEFLRYYMTDYSKAWERAPMFTSRFEQLMETMPEIRDIVKEAKENFGRWQKMPAVAKVASQISLEEEKQGVTERLSNTLNKLYEQGVEHLHPLDKFAKLYKDGELPAKDNPYVLARNLKGWGGKIDAFLEKGTFRKDYWTKNEKGETVPIFTGKSLREILNQVESDNAIENFTYYLVAKRSVELGKRKIVTGIALPTAEEAVKQLTTEYPYFESVADDIYKYQSDVLQYGYDSGLYKKETLEAIKELNQYYVPFHRVMEELQSKGYMGKGIAKQTQTIKRIKGSERDIVNPLEGIIKNTITILQASEKNQVMMAMANLANKNKDLGRMFERVPAPMQVTQVNVDEVLQKAMGVPKEFLGEFGLLLDNIITKDIVNIFRPSFRTKDNEVIVLHQGKPILYEVDPDLFRAIQSLDVENVATIIRLISYPAKFLRAGATLAPEFMLRNPARDQISAFVYSKYGFKPIIDLGRGMFSLMKKDDSYWLWKMGGGEYSTMVDIDRNYIGKSLDEIIRGQKPGKIIINHAKNPLRLLQEMSALSENGTRLGEAKKGLKRGADPIEAGYASREVTLDFARVGSKTKAINTMVAFWNAVVQGNDKMIRAFVDKPMQTTFKTLMGITLPSILLYMANRDEDGWEEIPQWQKDLFWLVKIGDNWWRIPKPFELGIMFGSVPERILEWMDTRDPKMFGDLMKSVRDGVMPGFIPTALLPIIENITNYSFFLDREIVSDSLDNLPKSEQYTEYNSEMSKMLGDLINQSPAKIDNLLKGWFAGLGQYAVSTLDKILEGTGIVHKITQPAPTLADLPLVKAFAVREPVGSAGKSVEEFYAVLDNIERRRNQAKALGKAGKKEEEKQYLEEHPEIKLYKEYNKVRNDMSEVWATIREIKASEKLNADEKRVKMDELNRLITKMAHFALNLTLPE